MHLALICYDTILVDFLSMVILQMIVILSLLNGNYLDDFDEFLFTNGNKMKWLRASKYEIIGADGFKEYFNEQVQIISSDHSCDPSSGKIFST